MAERTTTAPSAPEGTYVGGTSGDDSLAGGGGADKIYGWGGDDALRGTGGNDWLDGGHQDDVLDGGAGADSLTGGTGSDVFVLRKGEADGDWIHDFDPAAGDRIEFHGFGAGARLEQVSGEDWRIVDGDGSTQAIRITGNVTADSYDFVGGGGEPPGVQSEFLGYAIAFGPQGIQPLAMNADGSWVGITRDSGAPDDPMAIWLGRDDGQVVRIGDIQGYSYSFDAFSTVDINDAGTVLANGSWDGGSIDSWLWTPEGGEQAIDPPGDGNGFDAIALNNTGQVAGLYYADANDPGQAAIYSDGAVTPPGVEGTPIDINDAGAVLIEGPEGYFVREADGTIRTLDEASYAREINNQGDVLGTASGADPGTDIRIWHADGTSEVIGSSQSDFPVAFNDQGQILVGDTKSIIGGGELYGDIQGFLLPEYYEQWLDFNVVEINNDGTILADLVHRPLVMNQSFRHTGTATEDTIAAAAGDDILLGLGGDDTLHGGAGHDEIRGGDGSDRLSGGRGRDLLDGGNGSDYIDYADAQAGVVVNLGADTVGIDGVDVATNQAWDGGSDHEGATLDTLVSVGLVGGSQHGDLLIGNAVYNLLEGNGGDDRIDGGGGGDELWGGRGADTFVVSAGEAEGLEILDFSAAEGDRIEFHGFPTDARLERISGEQYRIVHADGEERVRIVGTVPDDSVSFLDSTGGPEPSPAPAEPAGAYLGGTSGDNLLDGSDGQDRIYGWGGYDTLDGKGGNDWLDGGHQDDVLDGGAGADSLTGGTGSDLFVFRKGQADGDWIHDFDAADGDRIELHGYGAGARFEQVSGGTWRIVDGDESETIRIDGDSPDGRFSFVPGSEPEPFDPILFFSGYNEETGRELWGYDGSTVRLLGDIAPGGAAEDDPQAGDADPLGFVWAGEDLVFGAFGPEGHMMWRHDAETGQLVPMVDPADGDPLQNVRSPLPQEIGPDGDLYFGTWRPGESHIWRFDAEDEIVSEVPVGADTVGRQPFDGTYSLVAADGDDLILIGANDDYAITSSFWRYDGETGTTALFNDFQAYIYDPVRVGDDLLFEWRADGVSPFAFASVDVDTGDASHYDLLQGAEGEFAGLGILAEGTQAYITVYSEGWTADHDFFTGSRLLRYDSVTDSLSLVADVDPDDPDSEVQNPTILGEDIYFIGRDATNGAQLWRHDGGTGAVEQLTAFDTGSYFQVEDPFVFDGQVVFSADDGVHGHELYRFDPATDTVERLTDIAPGSAGSRPGGFAVVDDDLYFAATGGSGERELWRLDGDSGALANLNPDGAVFDPVSITPAADHMAIA